MLGVGVTFDFVVWQFQSLKMDETAQNGDVTEVLVLEKNESSQKKKNKI